MTEKGKKAMKKRGRPTTYRDEFAWQAGVACGDMGSTDAQLARLFGVASSTLYLWQKKHLEFSESIKRGRDLYDSEVVERNLLKRANGYRHTETTLTLSRTGNMEVSKKVIKKMPPDVTAIIFWLKNRNPERWRDKRASQTDGGKGSDAIDPETRLILDAIFEGARTNAQRVEKVHRACPNQQEPCTDNFG